MSTSHCPLEKAQQQATGRAKHAARKLNFETEIMNKSPEPNRIQIAPISWRNADDDLDFRDRKVLQTQNLFPSFGPPVNPPLVSPAASSQRSGQASMFEFEDQQIRKGFRSLRESDSFIGVDCQPSTSDDVIECTCRASVGNTNVMCSNVSPITNKELSQNLKSLTDVMVNLNLTKVLENTPGSYTETATAPRIEFRQNSSRSETVTSAYAGPKIKFRSPSNYDQCDPNTHVSKNGITTGIDTSFNPCDLAPISHMLKTCRVFHPLDMEPKEPHPTPAQSPVRSLMDGGDAVDVRGLANRLARMKSESSMKDALRQYMDTHIPTMQGKMDQIIESTVQQIAEVSLRDKRVPALNKVSGITATQEWLRIQNGVHELSSCDDISNHIDRACTSRNVGGSASESTNASEDDIVELDMKDLKHHRIEPDEEDIDVRGGNVAEVCCTRGSLIHSEYISPEEYRFASYTDRKGKRKIQEVYGESDPSPERPRRKGKKKVAFAFVDDVSAAPEVIKFSNGSWD